MTAPRAVPRAVAAAAALLAVEGAALVVLGLGYGVVSAIGQPESLAGAELAAAFAVVVGLLLLVVARAVGRLRGWSRSPALVAQVLALPVGFGLAQGHVWPAAVPVLGLAVAVLYAFATAPARQAFSDAA